MPNPNTPGYIPATIEAALNLLTADARLAAEGVSADAAVCIVDGSMYAPSWRRIALLAEIWDNVEDDGTAIEMVNYSLDRWEANLELPNDASVGWHEGMLFVYGANFDHEGNF